MRDRSQAMLPLDSVHDHQRLVPGAASGAVSHRAIVRPGLEQRRNGLFEQVAVALRSLGRKELEGNDRRPARGPGGVDVSNQLLKQITLAPQPPGPSQPPSRIPKPNTR